MPKLPPDRKVEIVFTDVPLLRAKHHWQMSRVVNSYPKALYFYPSFDPPCFVRNQTIFVVHDLLPLLVPEHMNWWQTLYYRECIRFNLRRKNRRCIAVSETTRRDIAALVTARSRHPIRMAYEASFCSPGEDVNPASAPILELASQTPYLLYVGSRRLHKNLDRMIDIFGKMRAAGWPGRFLIVGNPEKFGFDVEAYARKESHIAVIDPVSDSDLQHLYAGCEALFFLTKYEGFGLPIVEAAQLGRKVIASTTGAAGEIAPLGSLLLDPDVLPAEGAARILEYLKSADRPDPQAVESKFNWTRSAELIFEPALTEWHRDAGSKVGMKDELVDALGEKLDRDANQEKAHDPAEGIDAANAEILG